MSLIKINNNDIEEFNKKYSCDVKLLEDDEPQILNTDLLKIFSGVYIGEMSNEIIMADTCNKTLIVNIENIQKDAGEILTINYIARWSNNDTERDDIIGSIQFSAVDFGILLLNQINKDRYTFKDTILRKRVFNDIVEKTSKIENMVQVYKKGDGQGKIKLIICSNSDENMCIAFISNSFVVANSDEYIVYGEQANNEDTNSLYLVDSNNLLLAFSPDRVKLVSESSTVRVIFPQLILATTEESEKYNKSIKPLVEDYTGENNTIKANFMNNMFDW